MTTEYTVERFQRAVKAFSLSAAQPQPDDVASLIGPKSHYCLRQRDEAKFSTFGQAWIDNDTTETYDPVEDSPCSKRKLRPDQRHDNSSKSRKRHHTFCSDPFESRIEKAEQQKRKSEEESSFEKELDLSSTSDYNLRTRNRPSESPVKTGKMDYKTETGGINSAAFSHAHSACVACRELGIECSLVEDPFYYPCQDCRQDELECKLDPPALWKRACEGCKKHREPCSYSSDGYDHSQPCRWCTEHGFDCIAGPAKRQPRCAEGQSRQSILQMAVEIPQSSMDGVAEDIFDISLSFSSPADLAHEPIEKSRPSHSKVHIQMQLGSDAQSDITLQGKICVIMGQTSTQNATSAWTPEAAPSSPGGQTFQPPNGLPPSLTVWHEIPIDGSEPCNWCYNFAYGIVGNEPFRPEPTGVYHDPYTGQRYRYTGATKPSRMCINCTIDRVAILKCAHSNIERMPGLPLNNLEICAAFQELAEASMGLKAGSIHAGEPFPSPGYPWCCICQEPASYECTDPQASTSSELSLDDYVPTVRRCDLRLCDYCAHYAKLYHGDLDAVYKRGADDPNNKTAFRADVALILKRSPNEEFVHLVDVESRSYQNTSAF
ncbi:hypothetical protein N7523_007303 [Penicillium sp. IBT 18751x]|nr:hypothetical protein N7523_007303 [Penicillium sp. IBT 18751x]